MPGVVVRCERPGYALRDIAATLEISERRPFGIVCDLVDAGYVVKAREGRRNRYEIHHHLPLPNPALRERTSANCSNSSRSGAEPLGPPQLEGNV